MTAHQTVRFYDPFTDAQSVRISGFSGRGEFWCNRPLPAAGRDRRVVLAAAIELIEQAIEQGLEPGEVVAG